MNPYVILAVVVAFVINGFYWDHHGHEAERVYQEGQIQQARADASEAARKDEHDKQEKVNETLRSQNTQLAKNNTDLNAALVRLRDRPLRPAGDNPRPECQGATGRELSREDAEFLTREAARADDIRTGLEACYQVMDVLK